MRRFIGLALLILTAVLFALVSVSALLDTRRAVYAELADWPTAPPAALDDDLYLSLAHAQLAPDGRWRIRAIDGHYLIPLFSAARPLADDAYPRALLRLPADRLAERLEPPDRVDDGIRIAVTGRQSTECHRQARRALARVDPTNRLGTRACLDDARLPADPVAVMAGLLILAAPLVLLGVWLRRGPPAAAMPRAGKIAKGFIVLAFVILIPLAKFADNAGPAAVKTFKGAVPEAVEAAKPALRESPGVLADGTPLIDLSARDDPALELFGKAKDAADGYQRLDQLGLLPDDGLSRQIQQLDSRMEFVRIAPGLFRLHSARTLMEERLMHGTHTVAGRVVTGRGDLAWDGVRLTPTGDGRIRFVALLDSLNRLQRGQLRFETGSVADWQAGRAVTLRSDDPELRVAVHGDRMIVRRGVATPARLANIATGGERTHRKVLRPDRSATAR
ncbi:hypothetical protein G3580_06210 [Nitrogeniibacter mangrovi]|uniref:Uncharacterized protein n=1 Tax=Nitrogeniibacter mangrovi TaxID=2016596 RepID=A0A6C1B338_9RHOO|nr:hypothetical protein [Nitrogeniibacter mangrovi]QID17275.1 hypothetical protein G3580_06210 [Nitrogeniibacter mangrovi]